MAIPYLCGQPSLLVTCPSLLAPSLPHFSLPLPLSSSFLGCAPYLTMPVRYSAQGLHTRCQHSEQSGAHRPDSPKCGGAELRPDSVGSAQGPEPLQGHSGVTVGIATALRVMSSLHPWASHE